MTHPADGSCVNRVIEQWPAIKALLENRILMGSEKKLVKEFDSAVNELKRLMP